MMRDIGKNIRELRLRAGFSQDELAERLFVTRHPHRRFPPNAEFAPHPPGCGANSAFGGNLRCGCQRRALRSAGARKPEACCQPRCCWRRYDRNAVDWLSSAPPMGHGACNIQLSNSPRRYSLRLLEALDVGRDRLDSIAAFIAGHLYQTAENGRGTPGAAHFNHHCFWRHSAFRHRLRSGFQLCLPCAPSPPAKAFQPCAVLQP